MDAVLSKIEGAATGVKLLVGLAEAQDILVSPDGVVAASASAASKTDLIACVTAWREAHADGEWSQVSAIVFGEVLKAFDAATAAAEAEAAERAAAELAAAELTAIADAAVVAEAEAAAAPVQAAQLAAARARIVELEARLEEQDKEWIEVMEAEEAERKEVMEAEEATRKAKMKTREAEWTKETNDLKAQVRDREERLRDLRKTYEANMEVARQGLRLLSAAVAAACASAAQLARSATAQVPAAPASVAAATTAPLGVLRRLCCPRQAGRQQQQSRRLHLCHDLC